VLTQGIRTFIDYMPTFHVFGKVLFMLASKSSTVLPSSLKTISDETEKFKVA
jgi:hypothetical protein